MYDTDSWLYDAFDDAEFDESLDEDAEFDDSDFPEVLRESLREDYADAEPEELEAALDNMFEAMSPAESFNFAKALNQIGSGASAALSNPLVGQIARTALPIAGGAAGTLIGGPAGTAVGGALGQAAAKALPSGAPSAPKAPRPVERPPAAPSVANGSTAAAQGLVLTQQPEVLKSLLALALGQHGRAAVNGVPVGAVMNLLSNVFTEAAADADELVRLNEQRPVYMRDDEGWSEEDPTVPSNRARALYVRLIDSENAALEEEVNWR